MEEQKPQHNITKIMIIILMIIKLASSRVESLELYLLPDGLRFLYKLSQQSENIHLEYWDVYLNLHSLLLGPSPKQVETVQLPDCRTVPNKKLFLLGLQAPKQEKGSSTALYQYQYQYQCTIFTVSKCGLP